MQATQIIFTGGLCKTDSISFCLYQMSLNLVVKLKLKLHYWTCFLDQTAHAKEKSDTKINFSFYSTKSITGAE